MISACGKATARPQLCLSASFVCPVITTRKWRNSTESSSYYRPPAAAGTGVSSTTTSIYY